jgi:DeoR/GlpR family transcriptional regulator of sugar metabolism
MSPRAPSDQRQNRLGFAVARLLRGNSVTLEDLKAFGAREDERTLRTDLSALAQLRTRRSRGALSPATAYFHEKQRARHLMEKLAVAEEAAKLFDASASIAATAGSMVTLTVAELMERGVIPALVTNSLSIAEMAPEQTYFVPGNYNPHIHALVGLETAAGFKSKPCRQGLIGVSGVKIIDGPDPEIGLYVRHPDEMPVLQAMVESVAELLVIVTNVQKLGAGDPWQIGTIRSLSTKRRVMLVTNRCEDWKRELKEHYASARETRNALVAFEASGKSGNRHFKLIEVEREPRKRAGRGRKAE